MIGNSGYCFTWRPNWRPGSSNLLPPGSLPLSNKTDILFEPLRLLPRTSVLDNFRFADHSGAVLATFLGNFRLSLSISVCRALRAPEGMHGTEKSGSC